VRRDEARAHDVVVHDLEDDAQLQDLVLSVHHCAMLTTNGTPTVKLVENETGRAWIRLHQPGGAQVVLQPQPVVQPGGAPIIKPAGGAKPPPKPPRKKGGGKGKRRK
jgi:hypothetical protein